MNGQLDSEWVKSLDGNIININTDDYKYFINEIKASELVISSSLHGIILAESYNVPAVFVASDVKRQIFKYYDWYEATERYEFPIASTYKAAMYMDVVELPNLEKMRNEIIQAFPYDIFLQ